MKAIIVKFAPSTYSVKTEAVCYWCRRQFWPSVEKIKEEFKGLVFYEDVIEASWLRTHHTKELFNNWK